MTIIWLLCYVCNGMPTPLEGWLVALIVCILIDLF